MCDSQTPASIECGTEWVWTKGGLDEGGEMGLDGGFGLRLTTHGARPKKIFKKRKLVDRQSFGLVTLRVYMASPFDIAWTLLKNIDFEDVGPMPTRSIIHPDSPWYDPVPLSDPEDAPIFGEEGKEKWTQRQMEDHYIPDMQTMLELEALRQASGGQQVPLNLLQPEWDSEEGQYPGERNWGATSGRDILNLPKGRSQQYPLPLTTYDKRAPDPEFTGDFQNDYE